MTRILVTGAAGFIASHLVDRFLADGHAVVGVDNFVRGSEENLRLARRSDRFTLVRADLANAAELERALDPHAGSPFDEVWHLAANSDIAAGVADADIDLRDTFLTTHHVLRFMRRTGAKAIAFASTSAVYGEIPGAIPEDAGPLFPISSYGAMKLASEAALSAALESYLDRVAIFRFPNVVGGRGTHGVIYDLLHKLKRQPRDLEVLGSGTQQKPYLHVSELIDALCFIWRAAPGRLAYYNIGPEDEGASVAFIARAVLDAAGSSLPIRYTGGDRGWVGDVPRFAYSTEKLRALGWRPKLSSCAAIERACRELAAESGFA